MRRVGIIAFVAAGAIFLLRMLDRAPLEVTLSLRLGKRSAEVRQLEIEIVQGKAAARTMKFRYEKQGAPAEVLHRMRLPPGPYQAELHLTYADKATARRSRTFEVTRGTETIVLEL